MPLTPADLSTLSRQFDELVDLPAVDLEARLAALPQEEMHLAPALRAMLADRDSVDDIDFMSGGPKLDGQNDWAPRESDLIGPYKLLREIGHGGMGAVWLAERTGRSLRRKVALKLPRLAWGAGLAERMARERDIGALLEHPNIARLYDAGVDDKGRPFLALEYIEGVAIDAWCEARSATIRQKLALFLQVARAVAYAHGRLVVHRDLKPSNILVTSDGQTHLLDFGIAKLLDDTGAESDLTRDQGRVMTPRYASPEQIAGEPITVASDVYSLGVLLYELLSGSSPYGTTRKTAAAIEESILHGEPALASRKAGSARTRELRGDLDAILAKSLKRNPSDRYASAEAMASDIERYLAGAPVLARPDGAVYRWRKTLSRHRVAIGATACVVLASALGGALALTQARRAVQQAERARLVTEFVSEIFRISAGRADSDKSQTGHDTFLDQGAQLIQTRFASQPDLQAELFGAVGRIYVDIGASQAAIDMANRELAVLATLPGDMARRSRALLLLTDAELREDRLPEADRDVREALKQSAGNHDLLLAATAMFVVVELELGAFDEARTALERAEHDWGSSPPAASAGWARLLASRARLLDRENDVDQSKALADRAIETALQAEGPMSRTAVDIRLDVVRMLDGHGQYAEAKRQMAAALAVLQARGGPDELRGAVEAADFWSVLYEAGEVSMPEAIGVVEQSGKLILNNAAVLPATVQGKLDLTLGTIYLDWADVRPASFWLEKSALRLQASQLSPRWQFNAAIARARLAQLLGDHLKAAGFYREAIDVTLKTRDLGNPYFALTWSLAASNLSMNGDFAMADTLLSSAPVLVNDRASDTDWRFVLPLTRSRIASDRGDFEASLELLPDLSSIRNRSPRTRAWIESQYGEILCAGGRWRDGLRLLEHAFAEDAGTSSPFDPELVHRQGTAGLCALRLGDRVGAAGFARNTRKAIAERPEMGAYYKRPSLLLERELASGKRSR